jgi:hypothetical protein
LDEDIASQATLLQPIPDAPTINGTPSILHRLPLELLHHVCAALRKADLGNLRLTCKPCATAGARSMVNELHLMFTKKSFENLKNISQKPELRKFVKSIVYEPLFLEDLGEKLIYDAKIYKYRNKSRDLLE